jgi:transcriptional regulator with XRE-family HTH domain
MPATNVNAAIGQHIRQQRTAAGLSQAQLAARVGLTTQQVHKYERGETGIPVARLQHIAEALEVRMATLFGEDAATPSQPAEAMSARRVIEASRHIAAIPDGRVVMAFNKLARAVAAQDAQPGERTPANAS